MVYLNIFIAAVLLFPRGNLLAADLRHVVQLLEQLHHIVFVFLRVLREHAHVVLQFEVVHLEVLVDIVDVLVQVGQFAV